MSDHSFDDRAATWDDDPTKVARATAAADAVAAAIPLTPGMRLLEYGAGTGLVSERLQGSVGPIVLADSSRGMLDVLRSKVTSGVFGDARAMDLDLLRDPVPADRFDLIVTVMTLHHIPDVDPVLRAFAELLSGDGRLCIIDLEREDGSFHGPAFGGHDGFDREDLAGRLRSAGFGEINIDRCYTMTKNGRPYDLFLATCVRNVTPLPG